VTFESRFLLFQAEQLWFWVPKVVWLTYLMPSSDLAENLLFWPKNTLSACPKGVTPLSQKGKSDFHREAVTSVIECLTGIVSEGQVTTPTMLPTLTPTDRLNNVRLF
jgi:hypothetical protein